MHCGGVLRSMEVAEIPTYAEIIGTTAPRLLRLAVMLTGSREDAEDLLQATLVRTHRHANRLEVMAAPAAYLRRVMLNEHVSASRRRARRISTTQLPTHFDEAHPTGDDGGQVETRDEMWGWLSTLTRAQRSVLVLRYYEDLPDAEIARVLDIPSSTVRSHAARGLATLRTHLADHPEAKP